MLVKITDRANLLAEAEKQHQEFLLSQSSDPEINLDESQDGFFLLKSTEPRNVKVSSFFSQKVVERTAIASREEWFQSLWLLPTDVDVNTKWDTLTPINYIPFYLFNVKVITRYVGDIPDKEKEEQEKNKSLEGGRGALTEERTGGAGGRVGTEKNTYSGSRVRTTLGNWKSIDAESGCDYPEVFQCASWSVDHSLVDRLLAYPGSFSGNNQHVLALSGLVHLKPDEPPDLPRVLPIDITQQEAWKMSLHHIEDWERNRCLNEARQVHGTSLIENFSVFVRPTFDVSVILLPIYITHYHYNNTIYEVLISGGHKPNVVGNRPMGLGRYAKYPKAALETIASFLPTTIPVSTTALAFIPPLSIREETNSEKSTGEGETGSV